MSYDPIHDTYTPSNSQPQQHSSPPSSSSQYVPPMTGSSPPQSINNLIDPTDDPVDQPQPQPVSIQPAPPKLPYQSESQPPSSASSLSSDTKKSGGALSISNLVSAGQEVANEPQSQKISSISSLINDSPDAIEETGDDDYDETDVNSSVMGDDDDYVATTPAPQSKSHKSANAKLSLKKADGEPFWRKDIQYDFLKALFDDDTACFTNVFAESNIVNCNNNPKISFGELYIRTLAESNKSSRVLKEKLIRDVELGKAVAKVCILVNVGRMNTTINFVPEMKSTLRTYHSIPSLQTGPEGGTVKQLQDTPRLKSILKAVCEGEENNLSLLNDMMKTPPDKKPNTNIIHLLFLLSNAVHGVPFMTDQTNSHLLDFFVNTKIHPANRAKRFLWLLYTFLETNFTEEDLKNNPFGEGSIPPLEWLDEADIENFDKDPEYERTYADEMFKARMQYLANPDDEQYKEHSRRSHGYGHSKKRELEDHDSSEGEDVEEKKKKPNVLKKKLKRNNPSVSSPLSKNVFTFSARKTKDDGKSSDAISSNLKDKIIFPVEGLKELAAKYVPSSFVPTVPEEVESVHHRCEIVELSKPMVQEVRTSSKASTASFNKKITILGNWLYRYFKYKKSIGNKLLGIEWEDIRYDLVHGVEKHLYESFGKSLNLQKLLSSPNDGHESEGNTVKHESSVNGGGSSATTTTAATVDEDEQEFHFDYYPLRDYDKANEKVSFILHLTGFVNDWFALRLQNNITSVKPNKISFDLDNETITI
ncbi:hypothetical protein SBY92_001862 [Candida maltosa Xu316]